jgi:hypothetical protein
VVSWPPPAACPKEENAMASEELKKRFLQEVKLRAYDDKYVDAAEEKEILKIALEGGADLDAARQALRTICENNEYVLESAVRDKLRELIATFAGNDGKVDEKEFNDTVSVCKRATQGKKTDRECKRMVLEVMEEDGSKVKTGLFSNWVKRVKKEVGMA